MSCNVSEQYREKQIQLAKKKKVLLPFLTFKSMPEYKLKTYACETIKQCSDL